MKKVMLAIALVLAADNARCSAYWPAYYACCSWTYETRPVTCYRPEWQPEMVDVQVPRWTCREVVDKVNCRFWVPRWEDTVQVCSYYTPVPRVVEQDVLRCRWAPVCWLDPCTGCPYVFYRPEQYVERVAYTVCDYRRDEQKVNVKVCRWEQQDRVVDQRRLVWDCQMENVSTVRYRCVMVPYQTTVCVPVPLCCK